jgi:hypothetical protein
MHKPFSIAAALKTAVQERMEREDAGYESEDEREVESSPLTPPPSSPTSPTSPLTPLPLSPSLPHAFVLPPVGPPSPPSQNLPLPMPLPSSGLPGTSLLPASSVSSSSRPPATKPSGREHDKKTRARHRNTGHTKAGKKARQLRKCDAENAQAASIVKKVALRHRRNSDPVRTTYNTRTDAPVTQPGWVARNLSFTKEVYSLETLIIGYGIVVVPWDGM